MPCGPSSRHRRWVISFSAFPEIADLFPAQAQTMQICTLHARPPMRARDFLQICKRFGKFADAIARCFVPPPAMLAYDAALNEGRALSAGDTEFGQWVALCQLDTPDRHERAAAMWAAANPDSTWRHCLAHNGFSVTV